MVEGDRKENTELFRKGAPRKTESKLFGDLRFLRKERSPIQENLDSEEEKGRFLL